MKQFVEKNGAPASFLKFLTPLAVRTMIAHLLLEQLGRVFFHNGCILMGALRGSNFKFLLKDESI